MAYVGSKACQACHPKIYASFRGTDMGRSMSLPGEWREIEALQEPVTVKHPKADVEYQAYREGMDFYQNEFQLDANGKDVFRAAHKVDFIIGSGANGFGGIVRRGDFLFESPLSYYTKAKAWRLSPGYEFADYGFNRPVPEDCIACHSGRPRLEGIIEGKYKDPPFEELAIGCENCHGPGALHVEERRKAAPLAGSADRSIVNPAKLPGWLADNVCMACHQGADVRALMPGKSFGDFRPGAPLEESFAIFAAPFKLDNPPHDPLLQHFVLMSLSRCYLKSGGRLKCISCHDPHVQPTAQQAPGYFREKCLQCHTERSCGLPRKVRLAASPPDNCIGCHMPRQNLENISHSSLTNHRIVARPDEPFPERAFHMTTAELPDLVYLDAIPGKPRERTPLLTLFRAYGQLMGTHPEYRERFESVLDELARIKVQDAAVFSALGRRELTKPAGRSEAEAARYLEQAVRAGSTDAYDVELLATLQAKAGKPKEAIATVQHQLELNPYSPRLYKLLASLYVSVEDFDPAMAALKKEVELYPEDSATRAIIEEADRPR